MKICLSKIPKHQTVIIPVASEDIPKDVLYVTDIKEIESEGQKYKVFDYWEHEKSHNIYPIAMIKAATGKEILAPDLWKGKPNSDKIYFFVCDKI